jgi:phosphoribosyl-AMP cyclohydrolase
MLVERMRVFQVPNRLGKDWRLIGGQIELSVRHMNSVDAPRGSKAEIEEGAAFTPKFDADGLIAAMAIDSVTREPLMLAYMNAESLRRTLEIGEAVYWSRSRQEFWHKGATSGHVQKIVEIRTDCDQDSLVLIVEQAGAGACHTGRGSCFYRRVVKAADGTPGLEITGGDRTFDPAAVYGKAPAV